MCEFQLILMGNDIILDFNANYDPLTFDNFILLRFLGTNGSQYMRRISNGGADISQWYHHRINVINTTNFTATQILQITTEAIYQERKITVFHSVRWLFCWTMLMCKKFFSLKNWLWFIKLAVSLKSEQLLQWYSIHLKHKWPLRHTLKMSVQHTKTNAHMKFSA